ncbi:HD-domain/PDEase-like protein, partial [Ramicandelaber brevisporus]
SPLLLFVSDVAAGYRHVPYHSFRHAVDVVVKLHHFMITLGLARYLTPFDVCAAMIAALCHDIGHPGVNNMFCVNSNDDLVKKYGEKAVLERYSCDLTLQLLERHQLLRNLAMRDAIIECILHTDMTQHYSVVESCEDTECSVLSCDVFLDRQQRRQLCNVLLHAVDIFNPALPWTVSKKWSDVMVSEFFTQGDLEKAIGLPVSTNMDRLTSNQANINLGFSVLVVKPFFEAVADLVPEPTKFVDVLNNNIKTWKNTMADTPSAA